MTTPIVAIAASAGGLEPLGELLGGLGPRSGLAYVVVQHLDPGHESLLSEILAKKTVLPVEQILDGVRVEANHVYVIPPNTTLTVVQNHLRLAPRGSGREPPKPADILFHSLALELADCAIGVVLSGGDSDGALGVRAIKQHGGITFAQEPSSARFQGMPRHAIETGDVDFVLTPDKIARELMRLGSHPLLRPSPPSPRDADGSPETELASEEHSLQRVFRQLRAAHAVDFARYKRSTLRRRLRRRMALRNISEPGEYADVIESDPVEAAALYQDFLIRVTEFFRDPESFDVLRQRVYPSLCEGRSAKETVRIWVPGCASGEEAYSLAIVLMEYLGEHPSAVSIQMFGTDVSEAAIEAARAGLYPASIERDVSAARLKRFFVKQDDHYRIDKSIRDRCIFARQDVTRDPPFSRIDLISCRNLLIYLGATAQRRVMQVFHYALRPQGFLLLGPAESVGPASELFDIVDKGPRLFSRRPTAGGAPFEFQADGSPAQRTLGGAMAEAGEGGGAPADLSESDSVQREANRLLLARYAPAGVLVDDALNVLHFHGETGPYLEHVSGAPSLNLQRLARPQLLIEIAPAVREARETGLEVRRDDIAVDALQGVNIQVIPLKRLSAERCFLILFEESAKQYAERRAAHIPASALPESEKDRRLVQVERELAAMREYMQRTMEQHEAVKEELKSAHEEVLSANEEFQSTNEELETSKEELQSANEELATTNDELRNRNRELGVLNSEIEIARGVADRARAYADAIIETVREPLVVLDGELRIVRANQAFFADFDLTREQSGGRLLEDVGADRWDTTELRARLEILLKRSEPIANFEIAYELPDGDRRLLSLTARKIAADQERAQLILLASEDVTERSAAADTLREGNRRKDEFLAMLAHELRNPLAPLTHTLHFLKSRENDPATDKAYDLMERQTRRLVRLVDELLDVARISRGIVELKRETVDLRALVGQAVDAARPRADLSQHNLSVTLPASPVYVNGDAVRLDQAVSNLIENAVKYTPSGGKIALRLKEESGGDAVLSIKDNGIGLAPEMLERIFDLFTQVDSTLARAGGGLGLGLTVVRRVLELHGGRIEARSSGLGQGSEFIVRLPTVRMTQAQSARQRSTAVRTAPSLARRVLIVDDNADAADTMALLMRSWGHEVAVARDGSEALALAGSFRPEAALVDIGLPDVNGYDLARRLRADPQHQDLHLMAMTGYGLAEDRNAAREAGFDVHLVKPAELEELEQLIAQGRDKGQAGKAG